MRILVVGYGNPSRMDDGVGHFVVNRLNERWGLAPVGLLGEPSEGPDTLAREGHEVRTMWLQQLDVGLAEEFAQVDRVYLIDAHVEGPEVVEVEVTGQSYVGVTSHVATPEMLVDIAQAAFGRRPKATRHSVRGARFDFGAGLSTEVRAHAEALAERLGAEVDACTN